MNNIIQTANFLKEKGFTSPDIGIVLGTGLGGFINHIKIIREINYQEIPHFPVSTVEFHKGKLILAEVENKRLLIMQGRFHYYEGYTMQEIVFPIRVMKLLGIKNLLVSNAAGAINLSYSKGEIMLLDDHINLQPDNPLRGKNLDELGERFPDMSAPYNPELNQKLERAAQKLSITLHKGVYASVCGPNLETRAEYRFLKIIGADAVGMSTVPEVIAANHMQLPVAALSVLTDDCDPDNLSPINIQEIIAIAGKAEKKLIALFLEIIPKL